MRNGLWLVGLVAALVCIGGCALIITDESKRPDDVRREYPTADETIYEIDAVSRLSFDSDRHQGYKRIATRVGLSDAAQAYLAGAVFDSLSFDSAKEDVLVTLIGNPAFGFAAEGVILQRLDELSFEGTKRKILKMISEPKAGTPIDVH